MKYIGANIDDLYKDFGTYLPLIMGKLESFEKHLRNLSLYGDAMEGKTADAIDAYINAVPLDIIHNFKSVITEYSTLLGNAHTRFNTEIDTAPKHINDDYLESLSRHIGLYSSFFAVANVNVDSAYGETLHNGSPAIDAPKPDFELLRDRMHENKKWVGDAAKDFQDFNTAHMGDVANVLEQLQALKRLCIENSASKMQGSSFVYEAVLSEVDLLALEHLAAFLGVEDVNKLMTVVDINTLIAYARIVMVDENGNVTYNFDYVEELLHIYPFTNAEIVALTLFYFSITDTADGRTRLENMQRFASCGYEDVTIFTPDGQIPVTYVQTTKAFNAVTVTSTNTVIGLLELKEKGLITLTDEQERNILEKMAVLQIAMNYSRTEVSPLFVFNRDERTRFSPILLNYNNEGNLQIQIVKSIKGNVTDLDNVLCTYGSVNTIGGLSGMAFVRDLANSSERQIYLNDNNYLSWLGGDLRDFALTETTTKTIDLFINSLVTNPNTLEVATRGLTLSWGVGLFYSGLSEMENQARMRQYDQNANRYDRIERLGGGVLFTVLEDGNVLIEHGVSFASSDNYVRTAAFVQTYQEEFDRLNFENATLILRNEALGNAPLPESVCGYTAEEQYRIGATYFDNFFATDVAPGSENTTTRQYENSLIEFMEQNGYGSNIKKLSLAELSQVIEEYEIASIGVVD